MIHRAKKIALFFFHIFTQKVEKCVEINHKIVFGAPSKLGALGSSKTSLHSAYHISRIRTSFTYLKFGNGDSVLGLRQNWSQVTQK